MPRIAGVDVPNNKKIEYSLRYVQGIGEVTAKKLIKEYGSVENVIANAANIKGKLGENVKQYAEQGLLSKRLATINLNVPVEVSDEDLKMEEPVLQEGKIIDAKEVLGGISEEDNEEIVPRGKTEYRA